MFSYQFHLSVERASEKLWLSFNLILIERLFETASVALIVDTFDFSSKDCVQHALHKHSNLGLFASYDNNHNYNNIYSFATKPTPV